MAKKRGPWPTAEMESAISDVLEPVGFHAQSARPIGNHLWREWLRECEWKSDVLHVSGKYGTGRVMIAFEVRCPVVLVGVPKLSPLDHERVDVIARGRTAAWALNPVEQYRPWDGGEADKKAVAELAARDIRISLRWLEERYGTPALALASLADEKRTGIAVGSPLYLVTVPHLKRFLD